MRKIVFLDPATDEMHEAVQYYEHQTKGLGFAFLQEIQHTIDQILDHPLLGELMSESVRRRLVRRFPFGVLYSVDPEAIVIVAVMHLRQKLGYWTSRV